MKHCKTVDIEALVQAYLAAKGYAAYAPPVPLDLSAGAVGVTRTGGNERAYVQDVHSVDVDCYGDNDAEAMNLANDMTNAIRSMPAQLDGVTVYGAQIVTLPYANPDPDRRDLARATLKAQITTRVIHTQ